MPWTLYRYILRELLKLLIVCTVVLVTVISFAAAVRPLSDGILGPVALMKFIAYTAPTMLGFVLPFAGAFSATLVFLRLASDNEITACSASGISYFSILTPVVLLGGVLTMGLFFSSNFIVPWFYHQAARVVEKDLMSALVNQLDRKQPYIIESEGIVLFADRAEEHPITEELASRIDSPIPPKKLIVLKGIALGVRDDDGRIRSDVTAEQANLLVFHDPQTDASWVTMKLINVVHYDGTTGELERVDELVPATLRIPSPFDDRVEFLSWSQLEQLRHTPDRYDDVQVRTRRLVDVVAAQLLLQSVQYELQVPGGGGVALRGAQPDQMFQLRAPKVVAVDGVLHLTSVNDKPVTVEKQVAGQSERQFEASWVTMRVDEQDLSDEPTLRVELHEVRVWDPRRAGVATHHQSLKISRMVWPTRILLKPRDQIRSADILKTSASPRYRQQGEHDTKANPVVYARNQLQRVLDGLKMRITAQFHSRAASAIACTLLLLLGAILSMLLKGQMPLVVFFWSFMLAVITIVIIQTGSNMSNDPDTHLAASLSVLWLGNVILAIVVGVTYCRVAKN